MHNLSNDCFDAYASIAFANMSDNNFEMPDWILAGMFDIDI